MTDVDLAAILAFVNARLDEREAAAKASEGAWIPLGPDPRDQRPIARLMSMHNPQFVLADVAAKRRIVEAHADPKHYCAPGPIDRDGYTWYEAGEKRWADIPCLHLRLLAAPFAQHPDFNPAWRIDD